jgi:hypothetical protein
LLSLSIADEGKEYSISKVEDDLRFIVVVAVVGVALNEVFAGKLIQFHLLSNTVPHRDVGSELKRNGPMGESRVEQVTREKKAKSKRRKREPCEIR